MWTKNLKVSRWTVFGVLVIASLVAFEAFNFDTTAFAFATIMNGDFLGISWSLILAIAFCGIDFAGIARIFTEETDIRKEPKEVWYLTAAWFVAATINALLTWWAISVHISGLSGVGNTVLSREQLLVRAPILIAVSVWLLRLLIIGTIGTAGDHLLNASGHGKQPVRSAVRPGSVSSANSPNRPKNGRIPAADSYRHQIRDAEQQGEKLDLEALFRNT